ncbi:MAG: hypothetical protein LBV19_06085 [Streptococcaceae bacterium]|jgi:hypothetical protein|nr:hypothetical protein [Streptococcaceae bacterium]
MLKVKQQFFDRLKNDWREVGEEIHESKSREAEILDVLGADFVVAVEKSASTDEAEDQPEKKAPKKKGK